MINQNLEQMFYPIMYTDKGDRHFLVVDVHAQCHRVIKHTSSKKKNSLLDYHMQYMCKAFTLNLSYLCCRPLLLPLIH